MESNRSSNDGLGEVTPGRLAALGGAMLVSIVGMAVLFSQCKPGERSPGNPEKGSGDLQSSPPPVSANLDPVVSHKSSGTKEDALQ